MRNANGFGGIVDLGKGRRNRYAIRITFEYAPVKDGMFRQKYKYIGYYPTRKEANKALFEYSLLGTPSQYSNITFAEAWAKWLNKNCPDVDSSRYRSYQAAYKKCQALYNLKMIDIRLNDLDQVIDDNAGASKSTLNNIKLVMVFTFRWALENDIVSKNYAEFLKLRNYKQEQHHKPISWDIVESLWSDKTTNMKFLIAFYTGCRPSELISLKKENVHLDENYFEITKSKTASGIRIVPIAKKIKPFFEYLMLQPGKKLFMETYTDFLDQFKNKFPGFTTHSCRTTFITQMTTVANVSEIIVQKIVGHKGGNVTRDVYTHPDINPLLEAVNKL